MGSIPSLPHQPESEEPEFREVRRYPDEPSSTGGTGPTTTPRFEHCGIFVAAERFEETLAFYEKHFGWRRIRELDGSRRIVFLGDGHGGRIEVSCGDNETLGPHTHIAVVIPWGEFDRYVAELQADGAVFGPINKREGRFIWSFCNDPAGTRIQLVSRSEPLPA